MNPSDYFWLGFFAGTFFGGSAGVAAVLFVLIRRYK